MKLRSNQSLGFSIIEIIIVLAVVVVLGFLGYTAYKTISSNDSGHQASGESAIANDVKSAPPVENTSDLDAAEAVLDQTDLSGSNNTDATQLDSQLSTF